MICFSSVEFQRNSLNFPTYYIPLQPLLADAAALSLSRRCDRAEASRPEQTITECYSAAGCPDYKSWLESISFQLLRRKSHNALTLLVLFLAARLAAELLWLGAFHLFFWRMASPLGGNEKCVSDKWQQIWTGSERGVFESSQTRVSWCFEAWYQKKDKTGEKKKNNHREWKELCARDEHDPINIHIPPSSFYIHQF